MIYTFYINNSFILFKNCKYYIEKFLHYLILIYKSLQKNGKKGKASFTFDWVGGCGFSKKCEILTTNFDRFFEKKDVGIDLGLENL